MSNEVDVRQRYRYTDEEWERLQIRRCPWPLRPFAYFFWVVDVMPERTGMILFLAGLAIMLGLTGGLIAGTLITIEWIWTHAAWVFWLVLGAGVALVARVVLRDAAAAELRVQRSIAAKEREP